MRLRMLEDQPFTRKFRRANRIIGERLSNDFGTNFGGGITLGTEARFYIEARYHYVWGPEMKPDQDFPLTFGFRF